MKIQIDVEKINVLQRHSGTDIVSFRLKVPDEFWDIVPPEIRQDCITDGLWFDTRITKGKGSQLAGYLLSLRDFLKEQACEVKMFSD